MGNAIPDTQSTVLKQLNLYHRSFLLTFLLVDCQVSKRWNGVISGNNQLWKRRCSQHGFVTTKPSSAVPSNVKFARPCVACDAKASSNDQLHLGTDSTTSSLPESSLQSTENYAAASDHCSQSDEHNQPFVNYKDMFLRCKRIFDNFTADKLTTEIISGFTNRITAIDYHHGHVATG